jgi:hypothetical protein
VTDEDYSELAECLESACQALIASGGAIGQTNGTCCPFGALIAPVRPAWSQPFPDMVTFTGIREGIAAGFMRGFDGDEMYTADIRAFNLGRQFRARYIPGAES